MANQQDKPESRDGASNDRSYKVGVTSDKQPGQVPPSAVNEGDHGAAGEAPLASDMLNFDDDEVMSGRGNNARTGGTWDAQGADSGKLAPPREIMSDRNGPSDNSDKKRPS
jgi:hypothetical protein